MVGGANLDRGQTMTETTTDRIHAVNNSASAIEACDVINSHGAVKYTHATDIGPACHSCDSVHGEGLYAYRFIARSAWEARCAECHNVERFATHFSGNYKGLGPDANAADVRLAHFADDLANYCADEMAQFDARMMGP